MTSKPWLNYIIKTGLKLGLIVVVISAFYLIYLDATLTRVFANQRYQAPALVYAAEKTLRVGDSISQAQVIDVLERLSYQRSSSTEATGYFSVAGDRLMVHRRPFDFADGPKMSQRVELNFHRGKIATIVSWPDGRQLQNIQLEPQLIGRINSLSNEDRLLVGLEMIPSLMTETLLLVEDKNFYHHSGVSPLSVLRALAANIRAGRTVQGGSTLTQQLVKNLYLTREQTLWRKFHEAMMSLVIDYRFDKNTILETYFNEVYFGQDGRHAIHGVGLASQYYFGRQVQELTADQVAMLIAMVKGPSYYDPRRYPERVRQRRDLVLRLMYENDLLSKTDFIAAIETDIKVRASRRLVEDSFPHYLERVKDELSRIKLPPNWQENGLKIFTALDIEAQHRAERVMADGIPGREIKDLEGAFVVSDYQHGNIVALVGGRNANQVGFNRAIKALRPIGSLIKPIIYATAMSESETMGLNSHVVDEAVTLTDERGKPWKPQNYDDEFWGDMTIYDALVYSRNLPAVRIGLQVGVERLITQLRKMGVVTPIRDYPSLTLGAVEMSPLAVSRVFSSIANDGVFQPLKAINAITTHDGLPVYENAKEVKKRVLSSKVAYLTRYAMAGVVSKGTAHVLGEAFPGTPMAGKTGTTNDYKDSWFVSIDGRYVVTAWLGTDDNQTTWLSGSSGALPMVSRFYQQVKPEPLSLVPVEGLTFQSFHQKQGTRIPDNCQQAIVLPAIPKPLAENMNCDAQVEEKSWLERLFGG
ncbi:MAG: penicillin-binding protein 1B [Pseudomonadota bacterium]|jgi:penicillin-binding protein 1B|nr:penicillin-binding protein 1B [Pseudomonadota bacterium]